MIVGILKEIKAEENRVSMTPAGVEIMNENGHTVLVENNAVEGSGFSDQSYIDHGAEIVETPNEIFERPDMVRLAHTMTRLVARPNWRTALRVDGGGRSAREDAAPRWASLAGYAPDLYELVRETYIRHGSRGGGAREKYAWSQLARAAAELQAASRRR